MLTIWGRTNSINVQKVLCCCDEIGLPYTRIDAGMAFGVNKTDDYLAMNPNGLRSSSRSTTPDDTVSRVLPDAPLTVTPLRVAPPPPATPVEAKHRRLLPPSVALRLGEVASASRYSASASAGSFAAIRRSPRRS